MTAPADTTPRDAALAQLMAPGERFELAHADVAGLRMRVFKQRLPHLRAIAEIAQRRGDERTFLVAGERRWGFAEFVASANGLGRSLAQRLGVGPGDRVAVLAQNSPEWCLTLWATVDMGAIAVGLNGWWEADEIVHGLNDCGASVLVADRRRLERCAGRLAQCPALRHVVVADGAPGDVGIGAGPDVHSIAVLAAQPHAELPDTPLAEDDPAIILYTSGTTGRPKGAVSTHRNVIAGLQLAQLNAVLRRKLAAPAAAPADRRARDVSLLTSPLFHVSGCHGSLIAGLLTGQRLVLLEGRIAAEAILGAIERERVTLWATVPTLVWRTCTDPAVARYDTASVTRVAYGGSPSGPELQRLVRSSFPNVRGGAGQAYGLTETSGTIAALSGEELAEHPGSVGRPLPTVDVRIEGAAEPGQAGEILVRGPMVTPGYWPHPAPDPAAAAEALPEGWLHTGDVGHLDAGGHLHITDRAKDVIIRGGENVHCVEIEQRLLEHPAILDAAVVGVPHAELGEEVKAIVVPADGRAVDADDLRAWVGTSLAAFKVPAHLEVRTEALPRNAAGKLIKESLR